MNKKCLSIIILFSFFVLISISGTVSAANLTVNPGGSIQAVVNNASSGDIITVNDNNGSAYNYTENLVINKKVHLQAKNGGIVTLQALNSSKPVITINSLGSGSSIERVTIRNATNSTGILLNSVTNCTVHNNTIYGNNYGINIFDSSFNNITQNIAKQNNYGLYLSNSSQNLICDNYVTGNQDGMAFYNSCNNNITDNNINGNERGIFIPAECTYPISSFSLNNTISQNKIINNHHGIYLWGDWDGIWAIGGMNTNDTTITSNIISENVYGVYSNSSQFNMHFNQLSNNSISDLWLEVSEGVSFDAKNNWWGNTNQNSTNYWWGTSNLIIDYYNYNPSIKYDIFAKDVLIHGFVMN